MIRSGRRVIAHWRLLPGRTRNDDPDANAKAVTSGDATAHERLVALTTPGGARISTPSAMEMPRRLAVVLVAVQAAFGLACRNEGEEPEPTLSAVDHSQLEHVPSKHCPDPFEAGTSREQNVVTAGRPFTWRLHAASATYSCQCVHTTTPQWSCDRRKVCTSSYDLGRDNTSECTELAPLHADIVTDVTVEESFPRPESESCKSETTIVSAEEGIIDITTTCPEGAHMLEVVRTTEDGPPASRLVFVSATPDGECPREAR